MVRKRKKLLTKERTQALTVIGGVLAGTGTLIAAVVGLAQLFTGEDAGSAGGTTTVVSASPPTSPDANAAEPAPYASFMRIEDDTGAVSAEVPAEWTNVRGDGFNTNLPPFSGNIGPGVNASPDVAAWFTDLTTPGVFVGASARAVEEWTPRHVATLVQYPPCVAGAPRPAIVGGFVDGVEVVSTCAGSETEWHTIAAWPEDHSFLVLIQAKLVDERDRAALDRVLTSLRVSLSA